MLVGLPFRDPTYAFRGFDLAFVRSSGLQSAGFEISPRSPEDLDQRRTDLRAARPAGQPRGRRVEVRLLAAGLRLRAGLLQAAVASDRLGRGPVRTAQVRPRPPRRIDRPAEACLARLKVLSVVGARPNMMKVAPVAAVARGPPGRVRAPSSSTRASTTTARCRRSSSRSSGSASPTTAWASGPGTQAQQTARALERVEEVLLAERARRPCSSRATSTRRSAASLAAAKLAAPGSATSRRASGASTARCPRRCPEQAVVADVVSDLHFIHSPEKRGRTCSPRATEPETIQRRRGTR